jgi:hypothetical protein
MFVDVAATPIASELDEAAAFGQQRTTISFRYIGA